MENKDTITKVVGSTFHPLPHGDYVKVYGDEFVHHGVPAILTRAVLIPEPDNPYDSEAVKVMIELRSGKSFHIGYIGKDSPIKNQITDMTVGFVRVADYSATGGQTSYQLVHIEM